MFIIIFIIIVFIASYIIREKFTLEKFKKKHLNYHFDIIFKRKYWLYIFFENNK